jgi:predicted ATP-grasp superfamily ATP-dependent carboligase
MARVLVTDGDQRAALAIVRSLGKAGHEPFVCARRSRSLAGASRHARGEALVPDAIREPLAFADALARHVREWGIDVLLPVAEPALLAVLEHRERFDGVSIPFPDAARFRAICDKPRLLDAARELGIAVPRQVALADREAAASLPAASLRFPVVLKPARSVGESAGRRVKLGVRHAATPAELLARVAAMPPEAFPLLVQERVVGPGVGVFLLRWAGERVALFAHRRLREKPPSGGISVYSESVRADDALVAASEALLDAFGWEGVAMVEFKVDQSSGVPYLMEVNGRFWGSLQLAIDAGVDFPRLLVERALGAAARGPADYRVGVRNRWWLGDVDHLLLRLRRSDEALSLPPGAPPRWGAVLDFLKLWRPGDRGEVLRADDAWPGVREAVDWVRGR